MNHRRSARRLSRSGPTRHATTAHAVAVSGTPRYARLRAAAVRGAMIEELLRRTADGRKVVLFRAPGGRKRNDGASGGRITVGGRFFQSALKDYADWRLKWWREAVQNAVDAGAKHVGLGAVEQPDGTFRVWCQDDGRGMTPEILFGKFLVLGESGKEGDAGATGGFGKAKEMLLLPWISWSVTSRGTRVNGSGIDYTVSPVDPPIAGTKVEVVMPADDHTTGVRAREFLARCHLRGIVFAVASGDRFSGESVEEARAALRVGKEVGELPGKAVAYYDKRGERGIYVRVNGLFMFDHWVPSGFKGCLIVEVTGRSTDLLTANRDGFRDYELRRWYEDLMSQIATDTQSALSKRAKNRKVYKGSGRFEVRPPKAVESDLTMATAEAMAGSVRLPNAGGFVLSMDVVREVVRVIGRGGQAVAEGGDIAVGTAPGDVAAAVLSGVPMLGPEHVERAVKQLAWSPDFFVVNDIEGWKVPRAYLPETMSKKALRLAKAWAELVRLVFIKLNSGVEYGIGWGFSHDYGAMYLNEGSLHWVLLNPIARDGGEERMLDPSRPDDVRRLWAYAIHEVTHCADKVDYHNEEFARALTHNIAKCADAWPAAVGVVEAVLGGADIKLREALTPGVAPQGRVSRERASRAAPPKMVFQDRMVVLDGTRVAEVKGGVDGAAGGPLRVVLTDLATGEEFGTIPLKSGTRAELERAVAAARSVSAEMGGVRIHRGPAMPNGVRQAMSDEIAATTGGKHLHADPISALAVIGSILRHRGFDLGNYDMDTLDLDAGTVAIDIVDAAGDAFGNTALSFAWHRFHTGRYEVVAYLS